jgi:NodT family efflux transporter outer membrane factor (OMF) lipoprotein
MMFPILQLKHKTSTHRNVAVLAAVLLSACATVGPDFEKPEVEVSNQWSETENTVISTETAENKTWWLVFEDTVLSELVTLAYYQNLPLQIAGLRILEARAQLGIAAGNSYPQSQQAIGSATYLDNSKNQAGVFPGADLSFNNYNLAFDATWELDFWGKFRRGVESADAGFLASIADYDDALVSLTAEVARAYTTLRTFEERLTISLENVDIQQQSVKIAEARFKFGSTTELDTKQAQTLLYSTLATVPDLKRSIRQTRNAIAVLLGITPAEVDAIIGDAGPIPAVPDEVTVGIPAELLRRRPDIRRAELDAASQSALIGVARADLYPSFVLFGTLGLASSTSNLAPSSTLLESDSVYFQGGPGFSWNLFNYGRIKNQVRVQDARFQQLLVNYQNTVLRALQETEDAMTGFLRTREQIGYLRSGVDAAQRAVEIALLQYQEGAADYTRVLNTQESLFREQEREVNARGIAVGNLSALYKALGGGWQIRMGKDFVPAATRDLMQQRTNWGHLLETKNDPAQDSEESRADRRRPAW